MGSQIFVLYNERTEFSMDARVTWNESYNSATNESTVTITKLEIKQSLWAVEQDVQVTGAIKINGTKCAEIALQSLYEVTTGTWIEASLSNVQSVTVSHDSSGAASAVLALDKINDTYAAFRVDLHGYSFYAGLNGNPSSYTIALVKHPRGIVYIDNGESMAQHQAFIDSGSSWAQYKAYIDNGESWEEC